MADFRIHKERDTPADVEMSVVGTDKQGVTCDPKDSNCVAHHSTNPQTGTNLFYLRVCSSGFRNGQLYDPAVDELAGVNPATNRPRFEWRAVGRECYLNYIRYLRTNNKNYLNIAERDRS